MWPFRKRHKGRAPQIRRLPLVQERVRKVRGAHAAGVQRPAAPAVIQRRAGENLAARQPPKHPASRRAAAKGTPAACAPRNELIDRLVFPWRKRPGCRVSAELHESPVAISESSFPETAEGAEGIRLSVSFNSCHTHRHRRLVVIRISECRVRREPGGRA